MRKRNAAYGSIGLLALTLCVGGVAGAAGFVSPARFTASVAPKHILASPPFTWTTTGNVVLPIYICAPGTSSPVYCVRTTAAECKGEVSVTVFLGTDRLLTDSGKQVASATGDVVRCRYSITTHIPTSALTATSKIINGRERGAYTGVYFYARFLGNSIFKPMDARTQIVIARPINPPILVKKP